jgi:LytS/YehU family sensor histidine kinase
MRVSIERDEAIAAVDVPPLVLQPLLENAVRHGCVADGAITVTARGQGDDLVFTVRSPGAFDGPREGGLGLDLVRRRVALAWGDRGSFSIVAESTMTVATVTARGVLRAGGR